MELECPCLAECWEWALNLVPRAGVELWAESDSGAILAQALLGRWLHRAGEAGYAGDWKELTKEKDWVTSDGDRSGDKNVYRLNECSNKYEDTNAGIGPIASFNSYVSKSCHE